MTRMALTFASLMMLAVCPPLQAEDPSDEALRVLARGLQGSIVAIPARGRAAGPLTDYRMETPQLAACGRLCRSPLLAPP